MFLPQRGSKGGHAVCLREPGSAEQQAMAEYFTEEQVAEPFGGRGRVTSS